MSSIASCLKAGVGVTVHFLNQPIIKENVKNIAGLVTFTFGLIEVYDIYQILKGREISTEVDPLQPKWIQTATKITVICAKLSLILSGATSRPGVFIISHLTGVFFTTEQLDRVFGPNTTFAANWKHPRHVCSLAAAILATPAVVQSIYQGGYWIYKKVRKLPSVVEMENNKKQWLSNYRMRLMVLFNEITCRPLLHIGNQLGRFILRRC